MATLESFRTERKGTSKLVAGDTVLIKINGEFSLHTVTSIVNSGINGHVKIYFGEDMNIDTPRQDENNNWLVLH